MNKRGLNEDIKKILTMVVGGSHIKITMKLLSHTLRRTPTDLRLQLASVESVTSYAKFSKS